MNFFIILFLLLSSIPICLAEINRERTFETTTSVPITTKFLSVDELVHQIIQNQSNATTEENLFVDSEEGNNNSVKNRNTKTLFSLLPPNFMSDDFHKKGGFIIDIFIFIYLCMVLALVIDSYFIPSLRFFCMVYDLSPNIIGSTLMVFGTSSPELIASVINVLIGDMTIGTNAIVVSSIFNLLAIPGVCGLVILFARFTIIAINPWPIRREIVFYSITIIVFLLAIKDDSIDCVESLVFLFIHTVYMFCLYLWSHFEITQQSNKRKFFRSKDRHWLKYTHYLHQSKINVQPSRKGSRSDSNLSMMDRRNKSLTDEALFKHLTIPFIYMFTFTIPKARKQTFVGTYLISSIWIMLITYLLIWMISIISETFHLTQSSSVMTMLALGNITKLIASVIAMKKLNMPEMAVCHSLASNIFNILICLGLPWLLKIFILTVQEGSTLKELKDYTIPLHECLFEYIATSLILLFVTFILIFYLSDWKFTIKSSVSFILAYFAFLTSLVVFDQYISIV